MRPRRARFGGTPHPDLRNAGRSIVEDEKPTPFADLLASAVWFMLACAIVVGAWQMDRLAHLKISFYTVPGLVPGMLGAAIGLMALLLMMRAVRAGALADFAVPQLRLAEHWRLIAALVLSLGFAIGVVGHGLPFWLGSAMFVGLFVFIFQYEERKAAGTLLRGAALACVVGVVSGLVIHYLFQDIFLVRLP
jgi:hypothetical protein